MNELLIAVFVFLLYLTPYFLFMALAFYALTIIKESMVEKPKSEDEEYFHDTI